MQLRRKKVPENQAGRPTGAELDDPLVSSGSIPDLPDALRYYANVDTNKLELAKHHENDFRVIAKSLGITEAEDFGIEEWYELLLQGPRVITMNGYFRFQTTHRELSEQDLNRLVGALNDFLNDLAASDSGDN